MATFRLDVAKPDAHTRLVFSNYTDAVAYCEERGLPVLPSVQLVQGRLKQFDDALCAALELSMAERRVQALQRLLETLTRESNAEATEHVATALLLAGVEPEVDEEARRKAEASRTGFLATPEARPCGFWDGDERLIRSFQSDRYLMRGFSVQEAPEACLALSRALAGDPSLREAFQTLRAFDARLTNPASSVSPEQMEGLTRQELGQRFAPGARFALISYSVSKEQTLIERLVREGQVSADTCLMALIVEAVRNGRLKLEPKPDSGWYDYQWYALETLLAPERGRESAKLKLTDAYRKRLENAFATALAKARETQIKRLPMMTLGMMDEPDEPPPKVIVAPEFAAEPTQTVYLRLGRAYRFLRQALVATLGEEELARVRLAHSARSVDEALRETAGYCYGLYDRLCLEIGQHPAYLPDELTAEAREQARAVFKGWRETWQDDPALAADARVAAPVGRWPGGRTRYWGAAGVRLERVVHAYLDKPNVGGRVEAEFVPCAVYLPTDVFVEFARSQPEPLTRAEFRKLCDVCRDESALRRTFGSMTPRAGRAPGLDVRHRIRSYGVCVAVLAAGLLFWRVRRARLWILLGAVALAVAWCSLLVLSPVYRTVILVRHVATINAPLGVMCENRFVYDIPLAPRLRGLANVMADSSAQTRYVAARFMAGAKYWSEGAESNAWFQAGIKESLLRGARDPDPEIAALAVMCLGPYHDADVTGVLLERLATGQAHDFFCRCILSTLGEIGDPRAVEAIQSLCEDSRAAICRAAIEALGRFSQPEGQAYLWRLAESPNRVVRAHAIWTIKRCSAAWWKPTLSEEASKAKCDGMLLEHVKNASLPFETRLSHAWSIEQDGCALEASAVMVTASDSLSQTNDALTCLAVNCLRRYGMRRHGDGMSMAGVISNMTAKVELARRLRAEP